MRPDTVKALHAFLHEQQRTNVQLVECVIEVVKLLPAGEARQPLISSTNELVKRVNELQDSWKAIQRNLEEELEREPRS